MHELMGVATQTLSAVQALHEALRSASEEERWEDRLTDEAERAELTAVLRELVKKRIEVLPAFELLVRLSPHAAVEIVLDKYLGQVSPDGKYGGYEFELASLLNDLLDFSPRSLVDLVQSPRLDPLKLSDARVIRSFMQAFDFDGEEELERWLREQGCPQP
ncbi:MAG: hypothetical protein H6741_04615 [Alphaproteobacteria bacterium]|nr:hypothetical protein [Alphaproteobacteria bacterium]MCB9791990.1 hypothetical protein [Alphaproteobacteria bacterium]